MNKIIRIHSCRMKQLKILIVIVVVTLLDYLGCVGCVNKEEEIIQEVNTTDKGTRQQNLNVNYEKVLSQLLLADYNNNVRPTKNSLPLNLTFGSALTQIIDVDERNQIITTNQWLNQMWVDESLKWDPKKYGGVKVIRIPAERVWKPDILLYNNADSMYNQAIVSTNVIVKYNGNLTWLSSAIFKSSCQINVEFFPFDRQSCILKFASWTYDGYQLDLLINDEAGDLSNYIPNGEWNLIAVKVKRSVVHYSCCEEPYPDITYTIILQRRPLFYVFNLILPCVLISGLALMSFYMPSDSGEKVTLGITTLLSMTVFLMVIGESMPPTSEKIPLIGLYYGVTISLVSFATGLSVVTLSIHHRGMRGGRLSHYMRIFLFNYLAPALLLKLEIPKKSVLAEASSSATSADPPAESLSCKIPLASMWRVMYPDYPSTPPPSDACQCSSKVGYPNYRRNCRFHNRCISYCDLSYVDNAWQCSHPDSVHPSNPAYRPVMKVKGIPVSEKMSSRNPFGGPFESSESRADEEGSTSFSYTPAQLCNSDERRRDRREAQILDLMTRVLETMEKNEKRNEEMDRREVIKLEYQQAALIIDRLLLWIFVVTTVVATFGILYMSPYTKLFTN